MNQLKLAAVGYPDTLDVTLSAACSRQMFIRCGPDCIATGCHGQCCDAPSTPDGCLVTIHDNERQRIEARGGVVVAGMLKPETFQRGCPFKVNGLCALHFTQDKPFGCIASPFTLNASDRLIISNRYRMLPCYRHSGPKMPAYKSFRSSLVLLFGYDITEVIVDHLDAGGGDMVVPMPRSYYRIMTENKLARQGAMR